MWSGYGLVFRRTNSICGSGGSASIGAWPTAWNPNDIFNSYNLLDFDYEERPGADAVKMQYLINDLSNIEAAIANGPYNSATVAAKYSLNRDEYDWQFLAGTYARRFTAGLGWSGNLGKAGFKGETQMFYKKDSFVVNRFCRGGLYH